MSITDELREYFGKSKGMFTDHVLAIADRIDAEHQKAIRELNNLADASMFLPVDADGVPIRVGDGMEWVRYKDGDPTIVRTVSGIGNGVFFAWSDEQGRYAQYEAHAYRHHHAPTVEDVLVEMLEKAVGYSDAHTTVALSAVTEYAAKLRLAEVEDA